MRYMQMLALLLKRFGRSRGGLDTISVDVENLIREFGVHAYEEARRRRSQSNDVANARRWSAVKSEIGRRILQECGGAGNLNGRELLLFATDTHGWPVERESARDPKSATTNRAKRGEKELERILAPSDGNIYCEAA
jgi:hypothetical protein